ncbi:ABC transporter substrate-binding protein [Anaerocellum diazotrophicum]|uniref:ABC transporter substrate-binding protein n=1 Tax=Caldicellulosiruptor diazotrophicus TaxID=2806205 RepID=A0ABN6E9H7_9FIRM|nr:ABC transporter substrate-binding protein [Caldicellulosiruptor diazotrophicus]BCS82176.1 ABC transporter substrate-binding protein [Caldicellulosiruptor diazotrophicus]
MKKKLIAFATLVLFTFSSILGYSSWMKQLGFNKTGLPIVKTKVTLKIVSPKAPLAPNYNEMLIFKRLEKLTNVHIQWINIPDSDYQEKKNLLLASGDLPDAFYGAGFSDYDLFKYSQDGTILRLDNLINQYMPNVVKLFKRRPDIKKFVTLPDGHIYSLPVGEELGTGKEAIGAVLSFQFINKKWLDKLGLKMPTNLKEMHDALVAFKTKDPNGNGKADEIPFSFIHMWWCADIGTLFSAFGMLDTIDHLIVKNGKVIFTAVQPQYRNAIRYFHQWVKEGLIDKESFTQTKDPTALFAKGKTKDVTLGSFMWWEETEIVGPDREKDYAFVGPIKGLNNEKPVIYRSNGSPWGRGAFVITKKNKYPEITARWIDLQYEPKMTAQIHWGPIGDVFEEKNGRLVFKPLPPGVAMGEYRQKVAPNQVGVVTAEDFKNLVDMEARAKVRIERVKKYGPYMTDENLPTLFFTPAELEKKNRIEVNLYQYVNKKRAEWLMFGRIDNEWNKYIQDLKKIGLDEYVKIIQTAYDRYKKSK